MKNQSGMTLIELIIGMAMIGILGAIALLAFAPILSGSQFKQAARNSASTLREIRSKAIAENTAYRAVFDLDSRSAWLANTSGTVLRRYESFGKNVGMAIGADCDTVTAGDGDTTVGELTITFNPDGTCSSATASANLYVCVLNSSGTRKFKSGIESTVSAKVVIKKRNSADTVWD